jgi:hypothetical protein
LAVIVMAEGSETPNGERGHGPEGRAPRGEGDLLAERRARRAAESGEIALTRRAEAAEATVQTLERHVASLQQRLREAEEERRRADEQIEAQRAEAHEREHELRRVKQREYAEQQLRVEAEERLLTLERESRAETERLSARLGEREREARELALRLDGVQRQLAEAEQAAAAERVAVRAEVRSVAEQSTQARLAELERRAVEIERGLDAERTARERSERLLEDMREGHRRMETLLGEMKDIVARVSGALTASGRSAAERSRPSPAQLDRPVMAAPLEQRGAEMADALAAAVERLRERAEAAEPAGGRTGAMVAAGEQPESAPAGGQTVPVAPIPQLPTYKHSMSWFARAKIKRKQRRSR